MAKGLRASTKKANKKILRQKVFGPVEDARKERLSAKLLELASKSQARPAEVDGKVAEEKKGESPISFALLNMSQCGVQKLQRGWQ